MSFNETPTSIAGLTRIQHENGVTTGAESPRDGPGVLPLVTAPILLGEDSFDTWAGDLEDPVDHPAREENGHQP